MNHPFLPDSALRIFPDASLAPTIVGGVADLAVGKVQHIPGGRVLHIPLGSGQHATVFPDGRIIVRSESKPAGLSFQIAPPSLAVQENYGHWPLNPEIANAIEALGGRVRRPVAKQSAPRKERK
jgi:hypothetical protein